MEVSYTDNPHNMNEVFPYICTEKNTITSEILSHPKCYFYDTCSFRRHANLSHTNAEYFLQYIKSENGIVIITRCILMELASHSGILNQEYIAYIKHMQEFGITVLVIYEEDLFSVMDLCFSTNTAINNYLCWAVRTIIGPVSTITATLEKNSNTNNEVIKGKNLDNSGVYQRFFSAVRKNKKSGDNLGEELLAICLHLLSHLPGEDEGKFCIITDDKGAAGKIDTMFKKTATMHRGKPIGIFSTPKLVQILYRDGILQNKEHMEELLGAGVAGTIVVLGTRIYDIHSREISVNKEELADLIMQPNGIHIFF